MARGSGAARLPGRDDDGLIGGSGAARGLPVPRGTRRVHILSDAKLINYWKTIPLGRHLGAGAIEDHLGRPSQDV